MKITEFNQAWLIHKQAINDNASTVYFITAEQGLIRSVYYPQNQKYNLQIFTPVYFNQHKNYIKNLEDLAPTIIFNKIALFSALYINELIYYTIAHEEPNLAFFNLYQHTLQQLATANTQTTLELSLRIFEMQLLAICGYAMSLYTLNNQPILPNNYYQFLPGQGFLLTTNGGILGNKIINMLNGNIETVLNTAKTITRPAINYLLDNHKLRSKTLVSTNA